MPQTRDPLPLLFYYATHSNVSCYTLLRYNALRYNKEHETS